MSGDDLERLMNDVLDGLASPQDAARLRERVAHDAEARAAFESLASLHRMLGEARAVEPPPDLKASILRQVGSTRASGRGGWLDALRAGFLARPVLGYAAALAAGIAVGVVGFSVLSGSVLAPTGIDRRPLVGAMAPPSSSQSEYGLLDQRRLEAPGGGVLFETGASRGERLVRARAESDAPIRIRVAFDPNSYRAVAFRGTPPGGGRIHLEEGLFEVEHVGQREYVLYLSGARRGGPPVRVEVRSAHGASDATLRAAQTGGGR